MPDMNGIQLYKEIKKKILIQKYVLWQQVKSCLGL
jgi:hypothetical protein